MSLLARLHGNAELLKLPPYLSAICLLVGLVWLLLLPLDEYSRKTYISENALLPGQVHTYFAGSEHNVFRAYRHEVADLVEKSTDERVKALGDILRFAGLKVSTQKFQFASSNRTISGENLYAILQGPRADATEAIVLMAAWTTVNGEINHSGVALVLTLARYFSRWSLWSKDIIFLIPSDSAAGPKAWIDAYHDAHAPGQVDSLLIKSGALQGAVAVEYPAGPWGHRFEKLHILYDGINGQLPNLDLINTAISIAKGQMGIGIVLQKMWKHNNSYQERLLTMLRGMLSQGLGHSSGPHSSFIPYHIDAITLQTVGDGWHDEMSLGRALEGLIRSLNNLLEHFHQSFFFYLLMHADRFVSIGTYLPSAMLIASSFTITSIGLWVQSGKRTDSKKSEETPPNREPSFSAIKPNNKNISSRYKTPLSTRDNSASTLVERSLFYPVAFVGLAHSLGVIPLYLFNKTNAASLELVYLGTTALSILVPFALFYAMRNSTHLRIPSEQEMILIQCFSLLLLGMFLSALATLNFSLALLLGLLSTPTLLLPSGGNKKHAQLLKSLVVGLANPLIVMALSTTWLGGSIATILIQAAEGWQVWGMWSQIVVWLVWWPAWMAMYNISILRLLQ